MRPKSSPPRSFARTFSEPDPAFVERARFMLWTALVVYPAFWLLDLLIVPEEALAFLSIRTAVVCVYLWALTVVYSQSADRLARPFMLASAVGSAAGLFLMAAYLDGLFNGYFADSILIILVAGFLLRWDVGSAAALGTLVLLIHLGINLVVHGPSPEMVTPLFIVGGSGVLVVLAALSRRWTQRRTAGQEPESRDFAGLPLQVLEAVAAGRSPEAEGDRVISA